MVTAAGYQPVPEGEGRAEDSDAYVSGRRPSYEEPPSKVEQSMARQRAALNSDSLIQKTIRHARERA